MYNTVRYIANLGSTKLLFFKVKLVSSNHTLRIAPPP